MGNEKVDEKRPGRDDDVSASRKKPRDAAEGRSAAGVNFVKPWMNTSSYWGKQEWLRCRVKARKKILLS